MLKSFQKGSKIGIIAPAFQPDHEKLENGIRYLQSIGYSIIRGESLDAKYGYLAGTDQLRIKDIHQMYSNPEISAIICARGGWGSMRLLDQLDFELIRNNPKVLIGYSDITTLQLAIWKQIKLPSISGPMVSVDMRKTLDPFTEDHFWGQINNPASTYQYNYNAKITENWQTGKASGTLLGGCLSMVVHLLGTPYSPDYTGSILFIEDIGEEAYRVDRYLAQLKQAGIFNKINGLIIGFFIEPENPGLQKNNFSVKEVFKQYFSKGGYPIIYNFPYGHSDYKFSMPIGAHVSVNTEKNMIKLSNIFIQK